MRVEKRDCGGGVEAVRSAVRVDSLSWEDMADICDRTSGGRQGVCGDENDEAELLEMLFRRGMVLELQTS
jgi:hypothetical protein